jgi:hypothetical protein
MGVDARVAARTETMEVGARGRKAHRSSIYYLYSGHLRNRLIVFSIFKNFGISRFPRNSEYNMAAEHNARISCVTGSMLDVYICRPVSSTSRVLFRHTITGEQPYIQLWHIRSNLLSPGLGYVFIHPSAYITTTGPGFRAPKWVAHACTALYLV